MDSETNKMYTKDVYDPAPPVILEETQGKDVKENADDEEQGEDDEFSNFDTDSDDDDDDGSKVR